jgi:regulatory protein YycI of two-component signal transduction system YycFG
MGTRSTIALEFADGTVEQVYCHSDGYLEHNGQILAKNYMDPFVVRDLIALGGFSSLDKTVEETAVTAYTQRGEDLDINKFIDFEDYVDNHQYEEYEYILRQIDGKAVWFVSDHDGDYVTLEQAIMDEQDRIAQEEMA